MKLSKLGIQGRFFNCLKFMYENSKAKIKLLNKLSDQMDVLIGTEQGHPMSPELFKFYLLQLSDELNSLDNVELPILNGIQLSHLLWADDLVLTALDKRSLQKLIDAVHSYSIYWGLTVNLSKTAILIFNNGSRQLKESYEFHYGQQKIPSAKTYCYLGIVFSLNGSFKPAQDELRKKGLRAYFSLKKLIDIKTLTVKSIFRLFDALILPIISYGCQVWLHTTNIFKVFISGHITNNLVYAFNKIAGDPLEKLHLKLLKWTLHVHAKTSNLACWGDSGRWPLAVNLLKQTTDYYKRLEMLNYTNSDALVRHAYVEQKELGLSWFQDTKGLLDVIDESGENPAHIIRKKAEVVFENAWIEGINKSSKLKFYSSIKKEIVFEPYLSINDMSKRKGVAQFRTSSHRLNNETGRYIPLNKCLNIDQITWNKCCKTCSFPNSEYTISLPFADPIIEDEWHVLAVCPLYHHIRIAVDDNIKSNIITGDPELLLDLFQQQHIHAFATYITKILKTRFTNSQS